VPERRRGPGRVAVLGVTVLVLGGAGVAATYTPLFAASGIEVEGRAIPRREVLAIARIDRRTNVFHLDAAAAERRLERDPRVLSATVRTSLPSAIRISVRPQSPVAIAGSPPALVGPDGVVMGLAATAVRNLPELRGDDLGSGAAAAAAMPPALRASVRVIAVGPTGEISLRLDGGVSARLGSTSDLHTKAASLQALLEWASEEDVRIASADVSVPGSPTVRLAKDDAAGR
jgi:cell division septal protein FtsQ